MNPYLSDYASSQFWSTMASRMDPVIGDVPRVLGGKWMDIFERCFSRHDFLAVETARRTRGVTPAWHMLELHSAAQAIEADERIMAGESAAECLAGLQLLCEQEDCWPDAVNRDSNSGEMILFRAGERFAVVRPVGEYGVSASLQRRAEATLTRLRKAGCETPEFVKRMARWPALGIVQERPADVRDTRHLGIHFPCPAEWLLSARMLFAAVGRVDASTQEAQSLVAAVFGLPGWNHLCGLLPPKASVSDWWSMAAPYLVYPDGAEYQEYSESELLVPLAFRGPGEAFQKFVYFAQKACRTADNFYLHLAVSLSGMPAIWLEKGLPKRKGFLPFESWVSMHPADHVVYKQSAVDSIEASILKGDERRILAAVCEPSLQGSEKSRSRSASS